MPSFDSSLAKILVGREADIARQWGEMQASSNKRMSAAEQQESARTRSELISALKTAAKEGYPDDIAAPQWSHVRDILAAASAGRARSGDSPVDTATFVFSLKQALFSVLREECGKDANALAQATWQATELIDKLGLFTVETFQKTREDVISRQQQELLELSTPVVRLWENVLALPLIGTLDSARTQVVMQNLLDAIVQTRSDFAIIDITGVPVVDTLVAQHLLKTVAAARLMGADCLISGIRPQIAQTIIHLGVDLTNVTTKATLADAFAVALRRSGLVVSKLDAASKRDREQVPDNGAR
ncbi:MAG TPA: STAS domain-containing protein [Bryobacteraceae bacterium]